MTTVYLCPTVGVAFQAFTLGGLPLNAGLIYTYIAGGTTPQATYTNSIGTVQNVDPIVLDADGRVPGEVWLLAGQSYRLDVKDSLGNLIKTYDNIYGIGDPAAPNNGNQYYPLTSVGGTANAITAISSAAVSALAVDQMFVIIPAATNTGATAITITPTGGASLGSKNIFWNGSALVAGEMKVGVPAALIYDGTQFNLLSSQRFSATWGDQVFTASGTFTTPAATLSTSRFKFTVTGGGGGGGGSAASGAGAAGGSAGATAIYYVTGLTANLACAVTVGTGGLGGGVGNNVGIDGVNTTVVVSAVTVTGGKGLGGPSSGSTSSGIGPAGGTATNGTINLSGGDGTTADNFNSGGIGAHGGSSVWGGGGRGGNSGNNGQNASVYGAGGGGGGSTGGASVAGGNGKDGIVVVEWVI